MDYYAGSIDPSSIGRRQHEMMTSLSRLSIPVLAPMTWLTLVGGVAASFLSLAACQMGFFALP